MRNNLTTIPILTIILVVFLIFSVSGCVTKGGTGDQAKTITVTDMAGRSVTLKYPVESLVLMDSTCTAEFSSVYGEGFDSKIVGWDNNLRDNSGDIYEKYVEKYPSMAEIPDVGSLDDNTFNVEKVVALNPDVVIMHDWEFMWDGDATKEALSRLDQAGIPVVFLDFYMDPMTNSTKSMQLLGKITGKEHRAQEIVDYYDEKVNSIYSRLEKIQGKKPTVYIECAYKGPDTYGISYGDVAWGAIVKKAGGDDIAEPVLLNKSKALSSEYLVNQSPDIIILTGRNWSTPGSLRMGYTSTSNVTKSTMTPFVNRPGWDTINAVENQKVYGIYHGYCTDIFNFVALEAFAKWFYPEEFKDVDPAETLKEYHRKFMPIDYSGTLVYSYY
ncbi:ABC transporter substrate-binding protein [Methanosarcina sp.]|uniref:ABC transporter substrate-binding protein n=1 Tax=Methanosarcina sp. TaxID=2213 RepID=UPI002988A664|nr:ABC transporter substrate-binding protein [Methanosarcina sp.]MDW5549406.1 ABC transporter substrate-binding protein [Methanosarcina sp.]MDW5553403.1 ABC transporter substrate-binding protein [Methanosarcina sp.]MDW5559727.1 ABC transporter substrate-binding protein [Methanosarcina sp.]